MTEDKQEANRGVAAVAGGSFALHVLASGSKGNAAVVQAGEDAVLIDCGITKKAFFERCDDVGFDPAQISAVIVTHEHTDHTKGLGVTLRGLARLGVRPRLYCTRGTRENSHDIAQIADLVEVCTVPHATELHVGRIRIQLFPSSHDAADPVGMAFETNVGERWDTLGYLTDSGVFPEAAVNLFGPARILALEANHDPAMLASGPYPAYLKQRVASAQGHLSNLQSLDALQRIAPSHLETVCGMHLSETNNTHRLAVDSLEHAGAATAAVAAWQGRALIVR